MTKQELINWAQSRNWNLDRFGHLKKTLNGKVYRFKLSRIAARYELKTPAGWVRIKSGYFSKLSVSGEGKLVGMTR